MSWEPEWGHLDELLALLTVADMQTVEARFRRALDEGALQDRQATPTHVWHERFAIGDVGIDWASGMMFVPWFDRFQERGVMPIHPQFRRAAWLELFNDFVPVEPRAARGGARVSPAIVKAWMIEWLERLKETDEQPTHRAAWEAARAKFESKATRKVVDDTLSELRPDLKPGPRGPHTPQ